MVKGANVGLSALSESAGSVRVGLSWSSEEGDGDADVSVLLLGAKGKVRDDGDFFFYNHPAAIDGSVQLLGKTPTDSGNEDRISLDLHAMAPDVEQIVVTASRDAGERFGDLNGLRLTVCDETGDGLLGFSIDGAGAESAFVFGEFYRRGGDWKFRAVGQGYETGLAGLATDFGIDVDDAAEDAVETEGDGEQPGEGGAGALARAPGSGAVDDGVRTATATGPSVVIPAQMVKQDAGPAGGPVVLPGVAPATPERTARAHAARRPRTAKKKVTLPKVARKSLAENETWRSARLFPVPTLKNDHERETRATSVLLAVMTQVPEFGRRLTAGFGAPVGRMETFTEVSAAARRQTQETRRRDPGRAGRKAVDGAGRDEDERQPLREQQVQDYMDIAARRGYEAVITLSQRCRPGGHARWSTSRSTAGASTRSLSGTCPGPRWRTRRRC